MRKLAAAAFAVLTGLLLCNTAEARPYSYLYANYEYFDFRGTKLHGIGGGLGWRPEKFFALQAGGQFARNSNVDFYNSYVEAQLILPLATNLSAFGSVGGAYGKATAVGSVSGGGLRTGFGVQYWLAPNWGVKATFHRQNIVSVANNIGLGLIYRF